MKIGITERGDPSIDFSWVSKMNEVDGAIIITKNLTDRVINEALPYFNKLIFHVTCTGLGGTVIEPNIPKPAEQFEQVEKLLAAGFPISKIVVRVDPIIPTETGLRRVYWIMAMFADYGFTRFRISLLDAYPHVRDRLKELGMNPPYGEEFSPRKEQILAANQILAKFKQEYPNVRIESCAEGVLVEAMPIGCVSAADLLLLGLNPAEADSTGFQRKGCLCCSAKTELLSEKKQCPYKCTYCYWKN